MKLRLTVDDLRPSLAGFSSTRRKIEITPLITQLDPTCMHTTCSVSLKWPLKYLDSRSTLVCFLFPFLSSSRALHSEEPRGSWIVESFPFDRFQRVEEGEFQWILDNILISISILIWRFRRKIFQMEIWFHLIYHRRRILLFIKFIPFSY